MRILQNNKVSEKHYRTTNEVYQEKWLVLIVILCYNEHMY